MDWPMVMAARNRFSTKVICTARDTADILSCETKLSMTASDALTAASISCCSAMGSTSERSFL